MEEIEGYSEEYKKRLDEVGESGQIPNNLALEVIECYVVLFIVLLR